MFGGEFCHTLIDGLSWVHIEYSIPEFKRTYLKTYESIIVS